MAVVRVRGLPYSATKESLVEFFKDVSIRGDDDGIYFLETSGGRPTGEAYVELCSEEDAEKALQKHRQNMGHRYIEVFRSTEAEMQSALARNKSLSSEAHDHLVLRLRGLPFDLQRREIFQFFAGIDLARNGVCLITDHTGKCSGEAYIFFDSLDMLEKAKAKHMERIGHRYIEIFKSDQEEAQRAISRQEDINRKRGGGGGYGPPPMMEMRGRGGGYMRERPPFGDYGYGPRPYGGDPYMRGGRGGAGGPMRGPRDMGGGGYPGRPGPYSRPGGRDAPPPPNMPRQMGYGYEGLPGPEKTMSITGFMVHMRGLPFSATAQEIRNFFRPLNPVDVRLIRLPTGRASGEADVDFASHEDAKEAMKKDRQTMDTRYIELFLDSRPGPPYQEMRMQPPPMKEEDPYMRPMDPYSKDPYAKDPYDHGGHYEQDPYAKDPYGSMRPPESNYSNMREGPYW